MKAEPRQRLERDWDAGLGWRLSLGELTFRPVAGGYDEWTYIGPDGADHRFYQTLHTGEDADPTHVLYTRDGSYLRLRVEDQLQPRQATVEFPDGTRHIFEEVGVQPSRRYQLKTMVDAWGVNWVNVNYVPGLFWSLTDSHGRTQKTYSTVIPGSTPATVVDRVELTAFDGSTLTYRFTYVSKTIRRSCKETCRSSTDSDWTVTLPLLQSVVATAGAAELERWEFPGYYDITTGCSAELNTPPCGSSAAFVARDVPGLLKQLRLPTRGTITYGWEDRLLLQRDENRPCNLPDCRLEEVIEYATGVARKVVADPYGAQTCGVWRYTTDAHRGWVQVGGRIINFIDELVTKVTSPAGDDTVYFFSGGVDADTGVPQQWHTGLPFSPLREDGGGRFLSSEAFAGPATVDCLGSSCLVSGTRTRAEYATWDKDQPPPPNHPEHIGFNRNRRVAASRTYYTDDPSPACVLPSPGDPNPPGQCRFAGVALSQFDGLGHYRTQTTEGNFGGGDGRTTFTNYNPLAGTYPGSFTLPPWFFPWILNYLRSHRHH